MSRSSSPGLAAAFGLFFFLVFVGNAFAQVQTSGLRGVVADPECGRDEIIVDSVGPGGGLTLRASPLPRPIPGVPPERNVRGISFAVANATGFLARAAAARCGSDWLLEPRRLLHPRSDPASGSADDRSTP